MKPLLALTAVIALVTHSLYGRFWRACGLTAVVTSGALHLLAWLQLGYINKFALLSIPISVVVAGAGAALIGLPFVLMRRVPRAISPSCRNCGYNLTGNHSGRCPECGQVNDVGI